MKTTKQEAFKKICNKYAESVEAKLIKEERYKKEVFEEFFKLKFFEIIIAIGVIPILIFIPYWIGNYIANTFKITCDLYQTLGSCGYSLTWLFGCLSLVLFGMLVFLWINKNWDWAKERVNKRSVHE